MPTRTTLFILIASLLFSGNTVFSQTKIGTKSILVNDSITIDLPDVFVTAERPLVKVRDGKLLYDIPNLIKHKAVDNVFDILGELPGVERDGDRIKLIGAQETNIIINGRKSTMSMDQLVEILKSTPYDRVKTVEIMYATPPQYGVRGASINLVFDKDKQKIDFLKGEFSLAAQQAYYMSPSGAINLSYTGEKFIADFSYSANYKHGRGTEDMLAEPVVLNEQYRVDQHNWSQSKSVIHNLRGSMDWDLKNKDKLFLSYTGRYSQKNPSSTRNGETLFAEKENVYTENRSKGPSQLHNARADYSHKNLTVGVDYTHYTKESNQELVNLYGASNAQYRYSGSNQKSQQANVSINQAIPFAKDGKITYGLDASFSKTANRTYSLLNGMADEETTFQLSQEESSVGVFGGISKSSGEKWSVNASVAVHYFYSKIDSSGRQNTLWSRVDVLPTLSVIYTMNRANRLQLTFSGNRKYPSYWATTPSMHYLNVYSAIQGNPELQPELSYSGQLTYILKSKYIIGLFANVQPKKMQQLLYLRSDTLLSVFNHINLDRHSTYGALAVIPARISDFLHSRLTLTGFSIYDKGQLFDVAFDRKKLFGRVVLTNTLLLSKKKNVSLEVSGFYNTSSIQGLYDIEPLYSLDASLAWSFPKQNIRATLKGNDLLDTRRAVTKVDEQGQKSRMKLFQDNRMVTLTVNYTFGGYKSLKAKAIDTSRLGTN